MQFDFNRMAADVPEQIIDRWYRNAIAKARPKAGR